MVPTRESQGVTPDTSAVAAHTVSATVPPEISTSAVDATQAIAAESATTSGLQHRHVGRRNAGASVSDDATLEASEMAAAADGDASVSTAVGVSSAVSEEPIGCDATITQQQDSATDYYSCNICFDTACDPVLTVCGHLFCWPCLHQWLEAQRLNPLCPVCKAGCGKDKVIPVYGRGKEARDPRRPAGQRPEPLRPSNNRAWFSEATASTGFSGGHHFGMSVGLGLFPGHFNWMY
ncbi:hypothetical protein THASP1DRAFT_23863, partial [Thamnocephalis sphaerospora]